MTFENMKINDILNSDSYSKKSLLESLMKRITKLGRTNNFSLFIEEKRGKVTSLHFCRN